MMPFDFGICNQQISTYLPAKYDVAYFDEYVDETSMSMVLENYLQLDILYYEDFTLKFKKPKYIFFNCYNGVYCIEDEELDLCIFADSIQELKADLLYLIKDAWKNYVLADDSLLAKDAKKFKKKFKNIIEEI